MAITQTRPKRKVTGTRYKSYRKKRKYELGNSATKTKVGERKIKSKRTIGGKRKLSTLTSNKVNLVDKKNKHLKAKIIKVKDNTANKNFIRRNILTKGAIIETDKGDAKITNRPGQEGTISAKLI